MASHFMISVASLVICPLILAASAPVEPHSMEEEMGNAVNEMQRKGYYSFAMLINMVQDSMEGQVTFLVPTDEALSETPPAEGRVLEFLQIHSIPAPLLYEDLRRLPDGTAIPTNQTGCMVTISSGGGNKVGLFLNGIELVQADVCVNGSSIRCHGINGVLSAMWTSECNMTDASKCPSTSCHAPAPKADSLDSLVNNGQRGRLGGTLLIYEDLLATITLLILLFF
ncbi:hypothetical protein Taro_028261 [Colocasia esculenta]|uniref:FAS1 domain-containing protein n=1 Tax=Colocasia esculenta TaxID=4460 RepID=A0A843VI31_COLES|nr:hypothetical protein [Colocasia esculenta]